MRRIHHLPGPVGPARGSVCRRSTRRKDAERPSRPGIWRENSNDALHSRRKRTRDAKSLAFVHHECARLSRLPAEPISRARLSRQIENPLGTLAAKSCDDDVRTKSSRGERAPPRSSGLSSDGFQYNEATRYESWRAQTGTNGRLDDSIEHPKELDLERPPNGFSSLRRHEIEVLLSVIELRWMLIPVGNMAELNYTQFILLRKSMASLTDHSHTGICQTTDAILWPRRQPVT